MIKGLIFDMDGVLTDNVPLHRKSFDLFLSRYGKANTFTEEYYAQRNEVIMTALLPEQTALRGWRSLSEEKEKLYRDTFRSEIKPTKGLMEMLEEAKSMGLKMAIGSSACRENVQMIMELFSLDRYISFWCCEDDVKRGKPDPEVYLKCAARLGLKPEECAVFEDASAGIKAANAAGCLSIALCTTSPREFLEKTGVQMIVDDFSQIDLKRLCAAK